MRYQFSPQARAEMHGIDMTEEEQHAVIQHEFDRLYDPRHPVRSHLETLDSVAVVRTIREALKR